jgi:SAM-dependent methyltransferase
VEAGPVKRHFFRDVARSLRSRERFRYMVAVIRQLGGVQPRECNLCGFQGLFQALGHPPRYDAECPRCRSRERHRLFGLLLRAKPDLGRDRRIVHFAPEALIRARLSERTPCYRTTDLHRSGSDLRLDIEAMELGDSSVDLFVLNHVLEHVDDARALADLHRCLVPGGAAIVSTPIAEGWRTTYENEAIASGGSDRDRLLHFGQADHVRFYGRDIRDRFAASGFVVEEFTADGGETVRYGLMRGETLFILHKPIQGRSA